MDTPVSAFLKLHPIGAKFLLESVEGSEKNAKYSFIGFSEDVVIIDDRYVTIRSIGEYRKIKYKKDGFLDLLRDIIYENIERFRTYVPSLVTGGLVGFLSYNIVKKFESIDISSTSSKFPLGLFYIPATVVIFYHIEKKIRIISFEKERAQLIKTILNTSLTDSLYRLLKIKRHELEREIKYGLILEFSLDRFKKVINSVKSYINDGDYISSCDFNARRGQVYTKTV